jgi:hypothetical protein
MNRILLTSTALVMVAGIAAADGHASVSWSGTATAGVARNGGSAAKAAVAAAATAVEKTDWEAHITANAAVRGSLNALTVGGALVAVADTNAAAQADAAEIASMRLAVAQTLVRATAAANGNAVVIAAAEAAAAAQTATLTHVYGSAAVASGTAGDFKAYSEVNATVTGTVTAGGMTLSAGMSVDAGNGYDFADDDTFDTARTNGVSLDSVSVDMGSAGKITLDQDATTHLVDGDDDASGDVKYTNTFGGATFTAVLDLDKDDLDTPAAAAGAGKIAAAADVAVATLTSAAILQGQWIAGSAAVAADTQWSAKVSMPLGGGSVYVAMDEESGNAFGGTAMVSGATVSIDSKLEALAADLKGLRSTTLGVSYPMGALTAGATYDSIKDGDQWGVSASYAAGDMTVGFSTDEGSDWSVTGAYALGTGASINAGVNYTEDAYLGLSFAF